MYYTYILENNEKTLLFVGTTTDLKRVMKDRKNGDLYLVDCSNLVYYEACDNEEKTIEREYAIKTMTRAERERLIKAFNPDEKDLLNEL
ncbi:MAG: GIY-YIG nuclease family protein [Clostridia bacterium]|nr:GIY-YIG nuclease family protein [Clostridia bacterium]